MRICYVLLHWPALTETFVTDEIDELRRQGHGVDVVVLEGAAAPPAIAVSTVRARQPAVWLAAARMVAARPGALAALRGPLSVGVRIKLLAVADAARRRRTGAVHAHFAYRSADAAEIIGRALGTGHSFTAHAHDIFVDNGDLARRVTAARRVVTVCDYNHRWMAERLGPEAAAKMTVIPCSVRIEATDHISAQAPRDPQPVVVAVGRLVPKKGLDTLIRAAAGLQTGGAVHVIGDGPLAGELRELAAALGADDRVRFLGPLDHEETKAAIARADVFCLPCRVAADGDRDSMPVVIKEAMAAGVPVVATSEVGVPEMVDDGVTGLLVPPDDPGALTAALETLLADRARRRAMGAAGRARAAERFDIRHQAARLLEVFDG